MGKLGTPGDLFCDPLPAQAFPRKVISRGVAMVTMATLGARGLVQVMGCSV